LYHVAGLIIGYSEVQNISTYQFKSAHPFVISICQFKCAQLCVVSSYQFKCAQLCSSRTWKRFCDRAST